MLSISAPCGKIWASEDISFIVPYLRKVQWYLRKVQWYLRKPNLRYDMYICSLWSNLYSMYNIIKEDFHIIDWLTLWVINFIYLTISFFEMQCGRQWFLQWLVWLEQSLQSVERICDSPPPPLHLPSSSVLGHFMSWPWDREQPVTTSNSSCWVIVFTLVFDCIPQPIITLTLSSVVYC